MEIFYSKKTKEYTLEEEVKGEKSSKRVPLKFKKEDSTSKYRKELLKQELLEKNGKNSRKN